MNDSASAYGPNRPSQSRPVPKIGALVRAQGRSPGRRCRPGLDWRRLAGAVAGLRPALPARVARLVGGAAFLVLACLAFGPQAGAQTPPPTASDKTVTATEDRVYTFAAADFNFADVDTGDALASVTIVTLPALGSLINDGTAVTPGQEIASADIGANKLIFAAAVNAHGDSYTSFTFKVSDGTDESALAYTMTVNVTAVNDAPTSTDEVVTTPEDTEYAFAADDFDFTDVDTGDTLASVTIVTLPVSGNGTLALDGAPVTAGDTVTKTQIDDRELVYTPPDNENGTGYASFTFKVSDGLLESEMASTMTVNVTAVRDAPTASDNTVTTDEDTDYTFAAADFRFADVDAGDTLASVTIVTLPVSGNGTLALDGAPVTAGDTVTKAEIDDDELVYTPPENENGTGYASFTFKVSDGLLESASAYTMTVDVTAANDVPTASDNTVATTEDTAHTFAAADFRFDDGDTGDALASVTIVTPPASGSLTNNGTAVTENQTIARTDIDAGRLVFTPAANADGDPYARFTFKVSDGGDESASAYTMFVDVTAVNDAPTAAHGEVTTLEDTDYAFAADDFNFSDVEVDDTLSSVRIVTLPALGSLTNDGTAVMTNQAIARADIDSGKLVFTPPANADGDAYTRFTFKVSDGTRESASTYTMTINVTATVETGMVQGWNARFGRTIGGQLVDAVTARFEFGGGSQVTLGGQRIGGFGPGEPEEAAGFADRLGWMKDAENAAGPRATRGMTGKELLRGSAFHLSGGEAGEDGGYVVWGHVAAGAFEARADGLKLDGDVTTRLLGVDGKWGRVLAGFALARSEGEGSFRQVVLQSDRSGRGKIDSSLSAQVGTFFVPLSFIALIWRDIFFGRFQHGPTFCWILSARQAGPRAVDGGFHARRRGDFCNLSGRARVLAVDDQRAVGLAQARGDPHPGPHAPADRCPALVDAPRGQPGPDQMHGVVGQNGDQQVGRDATVELVPDRAKAEFGFQAAEGGLDIRDSPIGPQDRLDIPVGVAGAQHIGARALIGLVVLRPALEADGGRVGAGVRLLDRDLVVPGDCEEALLEAAYALQHPIVALEAALDREAAVELFQRGLEAVPPEAEDRALGLLLALADDVEPRLAVLACEAPGPHLVARAGDQQRLGPALGRRRPGAAADRDPVVAPLSQPRDVLLGGDARVHDHRGLRPRAAAHRLEPGQRVL